MTLVPLRREWQRLGRYVPTLKDIEHFRVEEPLSPRGGKTHVGVVILRDGRCYVGRVREPHHAYVRKIWHVKSVGRALKRAYEYKLRPDFIIDEEFEGRDLYFAVRAQLVVGGWL